jgi:hypothetical protein
MPVDVFIGYSRRNENSAAAIQVALEQAGLQCYRDVTNIPGSDEWRGAISAAIAESHVFLALISTDSLASPHAGREIAIAFDSGKRLMPVLLAVSETAIGGDVGYYIRGLQYIRARPPVKPALPEIVSTARRLVDRSKHKAAYEAEERVKAFANLSLAVDFAADRFGLPLETVTDGRGRLAGKAWVGVAEPGRYFGHQLDKMREVTEVVAEVRLQKLDGPDDDWFGVEFGQPWPGDYYQFALNANGSFKFAKHTNEEWHEVFRRDDVPSAVRHGAINDLKVVRSDNALHVFINQLHAATLEDADIRAGRLGILVGRGMQVAFSNIQIHAVDPALLFTSAMELWNRLEMGQAKRLLMYLSQWGSDEQKGWAAALVPQVWPDRNETVLIAIGACMDAQLHDHAPAESLREYINGKGCQEGYRWARVVTDVSLLDEPKYLDCAVIALGGPVANRITASLQQQLPMDPTCDGRLLVQHRIESGDRRIATWGQTSKDTADATEFLISSGLLDRFLASVWGLEER